MGSMDVDTDPTSPPFSGLQGAFTPASSSTETGTKLDLSPSQLQFFDLGMKKLSRRHNWRSHMLQAKDSGNKVEWRDLFEDIILALVYYLANTPLNMSFIGEPLVQKVSCILDSLSEEEIEKWKESVQKGVEAGDWGDLIEQPKLKKEDIGFVWQADRDSQLHFRLDKAYNTPFVGDGATDFIDVLLVKEELVRKGAAYYYAKVIPVAQSSGASKSRTLSEAGRSIFTLPICLRRPGSPGYPPSDEAVYNYFSQLTKSSDLSLRAHTRIACFLAASHMTMLAWLKAKHEEGCGGVELLTYWHHLMELQEGRKDRECFFMEVVTKANQLYEESGYSSLEKSPLRTADKKTNFNIQEFATKIYGRHAKKATEDLLKFVKTFHPETQALCVTYFDEADQLGNLFWVLLRLFSNQDELMAMWYVFMATKSSVNHFTPLAEELKSLRLRDELKRLIPPYFALGFDQNTISNNRATKSITIGELQTLQHLCKYGRPLWFALFPHEGDSIVDTAEVKLLNGEPFDDQSTHHVLAVLSQRLCLDPVLGNVEALALTDRSVSHYMRLLTGVSTNRRVFYTHSPSEPMLVLGAVKALYRKAKPWGRILDTLSKRLCDGGLVEKGIMGELAARTLLIITRDFTAPKMHDEGRDLLQPIALLDFLDRLFGNDVWQSKNEPLFKEAFNKTYINYTHWVVTKDPLPEVTDCQLLANLYARGAALQCSFNQESLDLLIPTYTGPINGDTIFDPSALSAVVAQIKFKTAGDKIAGNAIRPIGIPRDLHRPIPYLALLLELGNESSYQETNSKIKSTTPSPAANDSFVKLTDNWLTAVRDLDEYRERKKVEKKKVEKKEVEKKKESVEEKRKLMDQHNRYSIFARGASSDVYGILKEADIVQEFATLLRLTLPPQAPPTAQDSAIQHMRPLERLGETSAHTAWMSKYVVKELGDNEEVDDMEGLKMDTQ